MDCYCAKRLVRIHASSGTTGKPTVVGYTKNDMDLWTECVSRIACMGGASSDDVAQISFDMECLQELWDFIMGLRILEPVWYLLPQKYPEADYVYGGF